MPDNENNEGMIEVPQNTREAYQVRIPSGMVELLEWQDLRTYGINIDRSYYGNDKIQIFRTPLTPHLRFTDGLLPSFFSQDSDHVRQVHENIEGMHHSIWQTGRGMPPMEFNNRNRYPTVTLLDIRFKNDPRTKVSLIPGNLNEAVALVLEIPERTTEVTKEKHKNRNIMWQYGFAPRRRQTMDFLVKCGFFYKYTEFEKDGFSSTHNLSEQNNRNEASRALALISPPRVRENVDYRGVRLWNGTDGKFKGMQFVYNYSTGLLVFDVLNKGTFDFKPPDEKGPHFEYDVYPWIKWGNMIADDEGIYMPQDKEEEILSIGSSYEKEADIISSDVKNYIYNNLFP